jgi:DNA-binding NarL/FixJ family response regulator
VDLTDPIPGIPALLEELEGILAGLTTVTCLGHMKWLGAFMCIAPVQRSLVGAATMEEKGFRLVERTEALDPAIRPLLLADDANGALVREALARGCNGICFASGLFMPALRVVLNHLMLGLTDQRISQELVVSPATVRTHVKHIFQKLQVDNRTKAVVKSIAAGLINLESALEGRSPITG